MTIPFNPANYRFKAVIDWVTLRVTLTSPSQFRHVQNRLFPVFGKLYVRACDGNDSSLRFDIRFQDPAGPDAIMRGLQTAFCLEGPMLKESDVHVIGLELALDLYSRTNDPESLAVAALHLFVHHAHPPPAPPRITKPRQYFVPNTRREILGELDAGYSLHAGAKYARYTSRHYVKRNDSRDGVQYAPLPSSEHRARFENTWRGNLAQPFKTLTEWRNFRFESLSEQFALVASTPATGLAALLQDRSTQLGRSLDKTGDEPRHPDAMAKSRLSNYRRKRAPNTQRDTPTNQKIRQALRNLTVRSKEDSPREFGGFLDQLTALHIGDCVNNAQSPIYVNTDNARPIAANTVTGNILPSDATNLLKPAIESPTQRSTPLAAWPSG